MFITTGEVRLFLQDRPLLLRVGPGISHCYYLHVTISHSPFALPEPCSGGIADAAQTLVFSLSICIARMTLHGTVCRLHSSFFRNIITSLICCLCPSPRKSQLHLAHRDGWPIHDKTLQDGDLGVPKIASAQVQFGPICRIDASHIFSDWYLLDRPDPSELSSTYYGRVEGPWPVIGGQTCNPPKRPPFCLLVEIWFGGHALEQPSTPPVPLCPSGAASRYKGPGFRGACAGDFLPLALKTAVTVPSLLWCTGAIALGRPLQRCLACASKWLVLVVWFVLLCYAPSAPKSQTLLSLTTTSVDNCAGNCSF